MRPRLNRHSAPSISAVCCVRPMCCANAPALPRARSTRPRSPPPKMPPLPMRSGCRSDWASNFGDPQVQSALAARGDDWSALIDKYIAVTNRLLAAAPKEMFIGMHLCRGNRGGHWHAEGSYEEVAERLFNALAIQFYFLEYDTPRAGSFTPLRFVPKHKSVVLGLVSTKVPQLEDKSALKGRI